ncbi:MULTISPECIES: hypothetical protein [Flavobacterium]|uniref:hypothetical protein n=1 Tax=Flavobacterium TaxID=237 RepID=UPI000923177E|nr:MULTISPECIES: hypothetical protein [Flavobacterium]MBJ2124325.1 hypothetical protein [Flavobacterium sp. IB48]OXA74255.1 hypothetical protein B0A67_00255 [Flavobacterium aquidurense]SHF90672.1 hypothetical protein SAMN05444481_10152 [Flavobacterium frigidimaris]
MKAVFLNKTARAGAVVLAVAGAFFTTSMQEVSSAAPKIGYPADNNNECTDVQVQCSDNLSAFLCRVNGTSGAIAYDKDSDNNCIQPLYRP